MPLDDTKPLEDMIGQFLDFWGNRGVREPDEIRPDLDRLLKKMKEEALSGGAMAGIVQAFCIHKVSDDGKTGDRLAACLDQSQSGMLEESLGATNGKVRTVAQPAIVVGEKVYLLLTAEPVEMVSMRKWVADSTDRLASSGSEKLSDGEFAALRKRILADDRKQTEADGENKN